MSQKLSKNLPKRAAKDHPSHAKRARSYNRHLPIKMLDIKENEHRAAVNRSQGHTGKERDNALRKAFGPDYRRVKRSIMTGEVVYEFVRDDKGNMIPLLSDI